jgi:hypothetical protein
MSNAIGFTSFQGKQAYRKAPLYIVTYYDNKIGLSFEADKCDTYPADKTLHGFDISEKCTCNACDLNCHFEKNPSIAVLEGFGLFKVLIVYGVVAVATIVIFFLKKKKKSGNNPVDSLPINKEYRESDNLTTSQI